LLGGLLTGALGARRAEPPLLSSSAPALALSPQSPRAQTRSRHRGARARTRNPCWVVACGCGAGYSGMRGPWTRWFEAAHVFWWKSWRGRRRDQIAHARKKAAALTQGKFAGQAHGQSVLQIRRAPTPVIKLSFSRLLLFFFIIEQRKFSTLTIKHFLWRDPSPTWRCEVSMRTKTVCDVETKYQWLILGAVSSAFEQWERAQ
jgi:hypothetical protein